MLKDFLKRARRACSARSAVGKRRTTFRSGSGGRPTFSKASARGSEGLSALPLGTDGAVLGPGFDASPMRTPSAASWRVCTCGVVEPSFCMAVCWSRRQHNALIVAVCSQDGCSRA
eukprot:3234788-Amphidinium_carterae.1